MMNMMEFFAEIYLIITIFYFFVGSMLKHDGYILRIQKKFSGTKISFQ